MKVVTILGSPRKNGNTAAVLGLFEDVIAENHEVERINVVTHKIKGCLGCGACQKVPDEPGCVQEDDTASLLDRMLRADALVYASPLYVWGFTSQMKALLDRHFCLMSGYPSPDYKSLLEGKRTALLVTCDGPIENNADLIQQSFDRFCSALRCRVVGKHVVPFCTTPDSITSEARETAKKMAGDFVEA